MRSIITLFLLVVLVNTNIHAQAPEATAKYWIYFSDKANTGYSLHQPEAYLSKRAVERRLKQNIPVVISDLPVAQTYIDQIMQMGINIETRSKWLNAVSAQLSEEQVIAVSELPFVRAIQPVKKYQILNEQLSPINNTSFYRQAATSDIMTDLGFTEGQIQQINLDTLFDIGLSGDSMVIAVLDAGFFGVDTAHLFQSFWDKEQILGYYNFPDNNDQVFSIMSGWHGSWVMSVIAGEVDSTYIGAAPNADLYLYRTEIAETEFVVEEDHWLAGAEKADSVGADIINSSLGYTEFDDPAQNHTWEDLDGNTTVVTNAADMAAEKGILVCNSAGNLGTSPWHYVSMPADGDSVFSIGGVDILGIHSSFSGFGPTFDGRLKPNVVALATGSAVLSPDGNIGFLNGTSFSSPLIAGACATLWQAFPEATNMDILHAVEQTAHLYDTPNDSMGYGIPNFGRAYDLLDSLFAEVPVDTTIDTTEDTTITDTTTTAILDLTPYMQGNIFTVDLLSSQNLDAEFIVYNIQGAAVYNERLTLTADRVAQLTVPAANWSTGIYICVLRSGPSKQSARIFVE